MLMCVALGNVNVFITADSFFIQNRLTSDLMQIYMTTHLQSTASFVSGGVYACMCYLH